MWIILLIIIVISFLVYSFYLKDYFEVKKIFNSLEKTLDTRDLLVMKLVQEIKDKSKQAQIASLVDARIKNRKMPYNDKIRLDVELNKELKNFYSLINKKIDNPVIKTTFKSAIELEKSLKKIRQQYNYAVGKYNMNLTMHKFGCIRLMHMKPLDTYTVSE